MKKIGILYICTGNYSVFWDDFFESVESNFLPKTEKHYHVFTDSQKIMDGGNERLHIHYLASLPWPLVALLKFHTYLSIENELRQYDYLVFFNSNTICEQTIDEDEFLPKEELGEKLIITLHLGYPDFPPPRNYPWERRKISKAYIPYNCGQYYFMAGLYGGEADAFLKMAVTLRDAINEDLKNNIIAKFHDESFLNRYVIGRSDCKILPSTFCYIVNKKQIISKILVINKQTKFDQAAFQGLNTKRRLQNRIRRYIKKVLIIFEYVFDTITFKSIEPM
jgi:hypothetical protein